MSNDDPRQTLSQIIDPLIDDIFSLSDEELLAEIREDGEDPDVVAADVARETAIAINRAGKRRMNAARAELNAVRTIRRSPTVTGLSRGEKEKILSTFAANDRPLQDRLTMAARSGQAMTEEEVDSVLLDLVELGALDQEGNPR